MQKSCGPCNRIEPVALLVLRVTLGVIMATHGWEKFQNIAGFTQGLTDMGIPYPNIAVYLAIAGELLGGLGLIAGFLTRIAALGTGFTMGLAVFHVHWAHGLSAKDNGFEYPLLLMIASLYFIVRGAGPISVDWLFRRKPREVEVVTPVL